MLTPSNLPDITSQTHPELPQALQWVGMENIAVPVIQRINKDQTQSVNACASLYVSLDRKEAKGIHMSRLHLALNERLAMHHLSFDSLESLVNEMVQSQEGISENARLHLSYDLILEKPSLLSGKKGFQSYPVEIDLQQYSGKNQLTLKLTIPYSSTCPCSASLTRQLFAEALEERFNSDTICKADLVDWMTSPAGTVATPHSQRSYAYVSMQIVEGDLPDIAALIMALERIIGTPVQTAVKREDEQAFARLNAQNLMFCEDAARRMKNGLENMPFITNYWFKVEHQESLHAHNAVAIDQKYPSEPTPSEFTI